MSDEIQNAIDRYFGDANSCQSDFGGEHGSQTLVIASDKENSSQSK